jgi:hypothetical protein
MKTPKDIADQFRELLELRARVSRAELDAAQRGSTEVKPSGAEQDKPTPNGRRRAN